MAPIQKILSLASLAIAPFWSNLPDDTDSTCRSATRGAVSSETNICSKIGIQALNAGGNAADAAIATTLCVGVTGMYHSGIGGGGFMIVRDPRGKMEVIDFRETAPAAATETMFVNRTYERIYGGKTVGVPGELRGLESLHARHGRLPWKELVMPAVQVAREGWVVGEDMVRYMQKAIRGSKTTANGGFLVTDPEFAIDFAPNGTLVGVGDRITRKRYADTLEQIANEGPGVFYEGDMADSLIRAVRSRGGIMTHEDLRNYKVLIREPVKSVYRGNYVYSTGAPASGASMALILNVLDGYPDLGNAENVNISTHQIIEAMRFGYAGRTELGDPSVIANVTEIQRILTDKETADSTRERIVHDSQPVEYYNPLGLELLATPGTSQISTADSEGYAVSLTTTINLLFGNRQVVPETGIILNNEMDDFSTPGVSNSFGFVPSPSNFIRPGARPVSSIVASIIESADRKLSIVTGAAGGSRILSATILSIINLIDYKMSVLGALQAPRFHDQLEPNKVMLEYAFNNSTTDFLIERNHNVAWMAPGLSAVQAIRLNPNGTFEAASEPRQLQSGGYAA